MSHKQLLFTFIAENKGILNIYNAPLFRAAFLKLIQNNNPSLASKLHDSPERKPYFVTALRPDYAWDHIEKAQVRKEYLVKPGQRYMAKISVFDETVLEALLKELLTNSVNAKIRIGNINFVIDNIDIIYYDFKELFNQSNKVTSAKIVFLSPTFFKTTDGAAGIEFFPRPVTVYNFLLNHWSHFISDKDPLPPDNFLDWVKKKVKVSSFKIRSESSHVMKKTPIIGTVGWVKYNWPEEQIISTWCSILLKFGEYAGLGALRTGGYGEIKVVYSK